MRKTIANKGKRPTTLTRSAVKRIGRAVNAYERGDRDVPGRKFRRFGVGGDDGETVRLGKTTAEWKKNELATITLWEGGTPPDESATSPEDTIEDCVNKLYDVASGVFVLLANVKADYWYLVASQMPTILRGDFTGAWAKDSTKSVTVTLDDLSFSVTARNVFLELAYLESARKIAVAWDGTEYVLIAVEC